MGIDTGFDLVPRLSKSQEDTQLWSKFIQAIKQQYKDDDKVEIKPNYLEFNAGEHPKLPFEGNKFLRFSSKVSGRIAAETGVEDYIKAVRVVAKIILGEERVKCWNEGCDERGFYSWIDVNASLKSYQQTKDSETISPSTEDSNSGMTFLKKCNEEIYAVHPIQGKGKGLIARTFIPKGTRIIIEKPLFTTTSLIPFAIMENRIASKLKTLSKSQQRTFIPKGTRIIIEKPLFTTTSLIPFAIMENRIASKLKTLSKSQQRTFLFLHNNFRTIKQIPPFTGIVKTNALPCGVGAKIGGIYPTICLINHSWNNNLGCETIHSIRPILAGEELTICYASHELGCEERKVQLENGFGFVCKCEVCGGVEEERMRSDERRKQIKVLDERIGDGGRVMANPSACLRDCKKLLDLRNEEYAGESGILAARVFYDAFQICITHGDQARASLFAEKAYMVRVSVEGEDSEDTKNMKRFAEEPGSHRNFRASSKWRTGKGMKPKGLEGDGLEEWLWRRAV